MIGILCSPKKEKIITQSLLNLFKTSFKEECFSIITFSLTNINILKKSIYGNLISDDVITPLKTELPSLVFNFAVQWTRDDIRKLRSLMEVENLTLINSANMYNQSAIMNMLLSNILTRQNVLLSISFKKENVISNLSQIDNFIFKPENGANLSKLIYGKRVDSGYHLYDAEKERYCKLLDIQTEINPAFRTGKWNLLKAPELLTDGKELIIFRSHLQRNIKKTWEIILNIKVTQSGTVSNKLDEKTETSLLRMVTHINCFIPDLVFCHTDYVYSSNETIFFLNFGGWQNVLLNQNQDSSVKLSLCSNIIDYTKDYFANEGLNYVG